MRSKSILGSTKNINDFPEVVPLSEVCLLKCLTQVSSLYVP